MLGLAKENTDTLTGLFGYIMVSPTIVAVSGTTLRVSPRKLVGNVYVNTFTSWFRAVRSCFHPRSLCSQAPCTSEPVMVLVGLFWTSALTWWIWCCCWWYLAISCFHATCVCRKWSISQAMAGHQAMVEIPWLGPSQAANGPCPVEAIGHYLSDGPPQVGSPKIIQLTPVSNWFIEPSCK